jgi:hypothetical protein
MNSKVLRWGRLSFALAFSVAFMLQLCQSSDIKRLSGSYHVVQKTEVGPHNRVQLQLRLTNQGHSDLVIQRVALWDFSHPGRAGVRSCSLVLRAGSSVDTTQEFTVLRSEYESWRGSHGPKLLLEVTLPSGRKTIEVVHLHSTSGKVN